MRRILLVLALVVAGVFAVQLANRGQDPAPTTRAGAPAMPADTAVNTAASTAASTPAARHFFIINIENKGFWRTWGSASKAPYLAKTLRSKGVLLTRYYGTAHNSQGNYIAQVSGQGPNTAMQSDCRYFSNFHRTGTVSPGQYVGHGCVFPPGTPTLTGQFAAHHLTWKGYLEGIGTSCRHPRVGYLDGTRRAHRGDEYAVRHNPFVYFHSVIDRSAYCAAHVVGTRYLAANLRRVSTTPNLTYITPDRCNDGHDSPCIDGRVGGLPTVNTWLKAHVPMILSSPAFKRDGVLVITADESDSALVDSTACCGEGAGANVARPGVTGPGGGRIGTLVISRWTLPGSTSDRPYNHYSLLGSIENAIGAVHLGYARTPGLRFFGSDVYNR